MRSVLQIFGIASIAIAAGCGGAGGDGGYTTLPPGGGGGPPTPTVTNAVTVSDNQFMPGAIQVSPGTTVTWTWAQVASQHNVTFGDGPASQNLGSGATFTRVLSTAGTYTYQCTLHPGMSGSITVQ